MTSTGPRPGQRVAVVTGGGGGIGAAIAEELGRRGDFVVTVDPLLSLDGSEALPPAEETTAGRIVAAGGSARASATSVTDGEALRELFLELGRVDAVVNVAGITRPTSFARGREEDWHAVLAVHLGGYLNVLEAALPLMAAAGRGRILGVTSGSGWRPADAGAYSCAKRAVAALTWQLGRGAPPSVVVNAMSPIAVTRMVTAALERARQASGGRQGGAATGGLSLGSMPEPEDLGPFGAHLVGDGFDWCSGRVLFAGGSEVAVIDEPRLLEVVRDDDASATQVLDVSVPGVLAPAEAQQASSGGSNPRFPGLYDGGASGTVARGAARRCVVVADRPDVSAALVEALEARGVTCTALASPPAATFSSAAEVLTEAAAGGVLDAVVVAPAVGVAAASGADWERVLAAHRGLPEQIAADAAWARAVADHAAATERSIRLVTLTDATSAGGRSRAQASAQLARAAAGATSERVLAFAVADESAEPGARTAATFVAHLVGASEADGVAGAELVVGPGWHGVRSHPRPGGSITFGGPELPAWFDDALRAIAGEEPR